LLEEALIIKDSMTIDEITNSILRPSPVSGGLEEQAKFLIIKAKDFDKIHQSVSKDMYIYEMNEMEKIVKAWDIVKNNSRKIDMDTDYSPDMFLPGKTWEEARRYSESISMDIGAPCKIKRKLDENHKSKIKSYALGVVETIDHRVSLDAVTKIIKSALGKHIKNEKIFECLTELVVERRIKSEFDPKKLKRFYSRI